jgi:hypothetical protein
MYSSGVSGSTLTVREAPFTRRVWFWAIYSSCQFLRNELSVPHHAFPVALRERGKG